MAHLYSLIVFILLSYITSGRPCGESGDVIDPVPIIIFVIGKVDATSARLLIEVNKTASGIANLASSPIACLQNQKGDIIQAYVGSRVRLMAGKPTIFRFTGLIAETEYTILFDGVVFAHGNANFKTYPYDGFLLQKNSPNIAAVSCNNIHRPQNHWLNLAKFVGPSVSTSDRISLLLHLGDQVYLDWGCPGGGGGSSSECLWMKARNILGSKNMTEWSNHWEEIVALFRKIYHITWGKSVTAKVLANVPNLAIFDDHEFKNDFGDITYDEMANIDKFIGKVTYYLTLEYQIQLHKDIQWDLSHDEIFKMIIPYHAHTFGDVGLLFTDVRSVRSYYYGPDNISSTSRIGSLQQKWINETLINNKEFSSVKALIFIVPVPLVYLSKHYNSLVAEQDESFKYHWIEYPSEQEHMLNLINSWKFSNAYREVIILSGDVHRGGFTRIKKDGEIKFFQVTTSPIANVMDESYDETMWSALRTFRDEIHIGDGWSMMHEKWTDRRNFGIFRFEKSKYIDDRPIMRLQLYPQGSDIVEFFSDSVHVPNYLPYVIMFIVGPWALIIFCGGFFWFSCWKYRKWRRAQIRIRRSHRPLPQLSPYGGQQPNVGQQPNMSPQPNMGQQSNVGQHQANRGQQQPVRQHF